MPVASRSAVDASAAALLGELRLVASAAAGLDLDAADGNRVAIESASATLRRVLERALEVLAAVQRLDDPALDPPPPGELEVWIGAPPGVPDVARIADVCFAGRMELRRVLRELGTAPDDDARLVAAEAGRRKLCRAAHAVIAVSHARGLCEDLGEPSGAPAADLTSALAIRRLYARFRHTLRRAASDSPEAVLDAVRYAGFALATLVADPCYADVRLSDRLVLRRLRERALAWARHDRSVPAGLQLLDDVSTCGNLLRGINRRQELRDHDSAAVPRLLYGPGGGAAAWFAELDALYGLDDDIDELCERARTAANHAGALDPLVPEALVRLGQVR